MSDGTRRARGQRLFQEVTGFPPMEPSDVYQQFTVDDLFGDIWSRPGLARKERRWISLTLAAASGVPAAYIGHLRGALQSGDISREELLEWLVQFAHYAGWPLSAGVYIEMQRLFAQMDE